MDMKISFHEIIHPFDTSPTKKKLIEYKGMEYKMIG
jgi:hypothetical protein